jgi:serine/threonine protein kinase
MIKQSISHYQITARLGEGGMGEVYRAHDPRLGRDVAIKVCAERFSEHFEREARAVASLNHPNICTLYDVGPDYLVMELVEGPTLAERILQGPIPTEESRAIIRQIVDALEAAHERGIVHRDLKPANIKLRPDGTVKVLDFGLAKVGVAPGPDPENSPTFSISATKAGMILGTAAYMAPEQTRGKAVDKRADIWSFGVVVYEMLTGRRLFEGETISDTLAAVLTREPDWNRVPAEAQRLLRHCLDKDPKHRLRDIGDARLLLEDSAEVAPRRSRFWLAWAGAAGICATLAGIGWLRPQPTAGPPPSLALTIVPPSGTRLLSVTSPTPDISPDGSAIVYRGGSGGLQLRRLNSLQPETLRGTEGVSNPEFWSPDSRSVAFPSGLELKKMRVPDGAPELITRLPGFTSGGTWSNNGTILVSCLNNLFAVSSAGGEAEPIDVPGLKGRLLYPEFLPDGINVLFTHIAEGSEELGVYLAALRQGKLDDPVLLLKNDTAARYTPSAGGRVLFVRNDNLYAQRLDIKGRKLEGAPELVERGVASDPALSSGQFSVSLNGVVAWRPGKAALTQLTTFDRQGRPIGTTGTPSTLYYIRLSPDETRLLGNAFFGRSQLLELDRPGSLGLDQRWFLWSPDGSRLLGRDGPRILDQSVGGSGEVHELANLDFGSPGNFPLEDVSPDGKVLLYRHDSSILSVRLDDAGKERVPQPLVQTDERIYTPRFSPDGRWVVYRARTRQNQELGIYVQPFPGPGMRRQIAGGGGFPAWRRDGREILYYDKAQIWSVSADTTGGEFRAGAPVPLFGVHSPSGLVLNTNPLAVTRDGSRIFFVQGVEQPDLDMIHIKIGWERAETR